MGDEYEYCYDDDGDYICCECEIFEDGTSECECYECDWETGECEPTD
jgi:hypothetical protein